MKRVIAIGMSGGVDSAVAAYTLAEERDRGVWDQVVGVSHFVWPDSPCCDPEAVDRARRLAEMLEMPFLTLDMESVFDREVVGDFAEAYVRGRTPNPCIRCNGLVRFTAFREACRKTLRDEGVVAEDDPLYFATGHYARTVERNGRVYLRKAADPRKDQAYMLYRVPPDLLPFVRFPLGEIRKADAVRRASELGLPSAKVRESQDACFVTGEYTDFIAHYLGDRLIMPGPGPIVGPDGIVLGRHRGYLHYTVGQRRGLGLGSGPWYVTGVYPAENRIAVGRRDDLGRDRFPTVDTVWNGPDSTWDGSGPMECLVRVRYNSAEVRCRVTSETGSECLVETEKPVVVAPGQSAVFYRGDIILGGGYITRESTEGPLNDPSQEPA